MERSTPTLVEALRGAVDARVGSIYTALPARVQSYDAGSGRISAQPLLKKGYTDETGRRVPERLPVVTDVPVIFPGCGTVRVKFPVTVGDTVLLIFASGSLDRWLSKGGEVDPEDDRKHSLTDAIAIPGLSHAPEDGDPMIEFTSNGQIHAGGSSALALQSDLQTLRNFVNTLFTGGTGSAVVPAPSVGSGTTVLKGS